MKISTRGRYALRIMIDLAEHGGGEYIPLKDVVERQEISKKYAESIMIELSKSGLVDATHGKGGGYRLKRGAAKEIENALIAFGEYHARGDDDDLEKMELVFRFLILLRKYCIDNAAGDKKRDKAISNMKGIVNYIDEHYQEPLDLNSVAEEFHYTSAHLSRMFKEHIGHNFYTYLQDVRLMHCVEEMKADPNVRLLDCAMNNGFPNVKSFIQTFKKTFGCTPSDWLKDRH